jgi:hypothetical protein
MGRLEGLHLDEVEKLGRKGGFMREGDRTRRSETVEKIKANCKQSRNLSKIFKYSI